jgi:hypothetical protein
MEFPRQSPSAPSNAATQSFVMHIFRPKEVRLRQKGKPGGSDGSGPVQVIQNPKSADALSMGRFLDEMVRRLARDSRQQRETVPFILGGKQVLATARSPRLELSPLLSFFYFYFLFLRLDHEV